MFLFWIIVIIIVVVMYNNSKKTKKEHEDAGQFNENSKLIVGKWQVENGNSYIRLRKNTSFS